MSHDAEDDPEALARTADLAAALQKSRPGCWRQAVKLLAEWPAGPSRDAAVETLRAHIAAQRWPSLHPRMKLKPAALGHPALGVAAVVEVTASRKDAALVFSVPSGATRLRLDLRRGAIAAVQGLACFASLRDFDLHGSAHTARIEDLDAIATLEAVTLRLADTAAFALRRDSPGPRCGPGSTSTRPRKNSRVGRRDRNAHACCTRCPHEAHIP